MSPLTPLPTLLDIDASEFVKIMKAPFSGTFKARNFEIIMSRLFGMSSLLKLEDERTETVFDYGWLNMIFESCQTHIVYNYSISSSSESLKLWAIWSVAQYFVSSKLKTSFGSPPQVLMLQPTHRVSRQLSIC